MIVAWLGNIRLELPAWPTALERGATHSYAEHQPVGRPPLLQSTGRNLVDFRLEGRLHRQFGTPPAESLSALRAAVAAAEALPLVFGTGEYPGKFVVAELREVTESFSRAGDPDSVLVSLSLREYVETDRLAAPFRRQADIARGLRRQVVEGLRRWLS